MTDVIIKQKINERTFFMGRIFNNDFTLTVLKVLKFLILQNNKIR